MANEILNSVIAMISVIMCSIILIIIIWKNYNRPSQPKVLIFLLLLLFISLLINLISAFIPLTVQLLWALMIVLYLIISHNKKPKMREIKQTPTYQDNALLISQVKEQERSRIYANLHDDVGAKLLELVYAAKDDESRNLAKDILKEVRQAVASTENFQCTVAQLVNTLLSESQLRLKPLSINQTEEINLLDENRKLALTAPNVILRMCREVISNILKHAKANNINIKIDSDETRLNVEIKDDGMGFTSDNTAGKGLKTITKRAHSIAAEVKWQSNSKGTTFVLTYSYGN
jgi:signal transduction histidine kinase